MVFGKTHNAELSGAMFMIMITSNLNNLKPLEMRMV